MSIETTTDYSAALQHVVISDESAIGRILMRGRDRAALLQRLSTNDIERLQPGQGAQTVLTTPIGRIIDLLTIYALEDSLLILTSTGQGPAVFSHLKRNIFFNDQVTLEPTGRSHAVLALYGPQSATLLTTLTGRDLTNLPLHHTARGQISQIDLLVARRTAIGGAGFTLYIPIEGLSVIRAELEQHASPLGSEAYEALRIEQGIPLFGNELSQEYIPLEAGLNDTISFQKGCYVGQEIIARMDSRGKLAKQLRGLRLSAPVAAPTKLAVAGKEAGDLTSSTISPRYGPIALAYVRTAHAEPGTQIGIANSEITAEVVELPFHD